MVTLREVKNIAVLNPIHPIDLARSRFPDAAGSLTRAFMLDPLWGYVFPDPQTRERSLLRLWGGALRFSQAYGKVYATPDVAGVACWVAPGRTAMSLWQQARTGMALPRAVLSFERGDRRRFLAALISIDRMHKELMHERHWYLLALGVTPERRRRGIGSSLLEPILERTEEAGLPCYLDTQNEANVAFYKNRGFRVVHEGTIPGLSVRTWMMVRQPT